MPPPSFIPLLPTLPLSWTSWWFLLCSRGHWCLAVLPVFFLDVQCLNSMLLSVFSKLCRKNCYTPIFVFDIRWCVQSWRDWKSMVEIWFDDWGLEVALFLTFPRRNNEVFFKSKTCINYEFVLSLSMHVIHTWLNICLLINLSLLRDFWSSDSRVGLFFFNFFFTKWPMPTAILEQCGCG